MYLKPSPGCSVPDIERGGLLAVAGRLVVPTTYWHRRVDDGDVVEISKDEHEQLLADQAAADAKAAAAAAEAPAVAEKPADDTVQTSARTAKNGGK